MAKSKKNNGASDPNNGGSTDPLDFWEETKKVITDFKRDCDEVQLKAADAALQVAQANMAAALGASCDNRRAWNKAERTRQFYAGIHFYVATGLNKDVLELQKQTDEQIKAAEEFGKTFAAATAKLKEACAKLQTVGTLASDWQMKGVNASCYTKNKKDLNLILSPDTLPNKDPEDKLSAWAADFNHLAVDAQNDADQVGETLVKVAGIVSFTNVKSIKVCTEALKTAAEAFKADVEGNVKAADDKVKSAQKTLAEELPKLGESDFEQHKAGANQASIKTISTYLSVLPPNLGDIPTLDEICKALEKTAASPLTKTNKQ